MAHLDVDICDFFEPFLLALVVEVYFLAETVEVEVEGSNVPLFLPKDVGAEVGMQEVAVLELLNLDRNKDTMER